METWQRIEMIEKIRELRMAGKPELAAPLQAAFDRNEYYTGEEEEPEPEVKVPSRSGGRPLWVAYALEHSQIEPEVIEDSKRDDIIGMLEANGIIERKQ